MDSDAQGERGLDNALAWAEVPAADFDLWTTQTPDYQGALAKHSSRYQSNPSFDLLLEELNSQRDTRSQTEVSLVESVRQAEIAERETDREERLALFRKAFGAGDADGDDEEEEFPDIILNEAASVLGDLLAQK